MFFKAGQATIDGILRAVGLRRDRLDSAPTRITELIREAQQDPYNGFVSRFQFPLTDQGSHDVSGICDEGVADLVLGGFLFPLDVATRRVG